MCIRDRFKAAFKEIGVSATVMTFYDFMKNKSKYDYILSDEVQDMTGRVLTAMNNRSKHVIVAGDQHQSIYDTDPKFREATVKPSDILSLLNCRNFALRIIHRLSSSIISAIEKFIPDIDIFTARRDMTKRNTQIRLCTADSEDEEVKYIMKEAQKAVNVGDTAAILIPSQQKILDFIQSVLKDQGKQPWTIVKNDWDKPDFGSLNSYLLTNGVKLQYVGNSYGGLSESDGLVRIMTYHSSKGLDFDNVFLPGLDRSFYINGNDTLSRTLFMVAMTRSRNNLYLTHWGSMSAYLSSFADDCSIWYSPFLDRG